MNRPYSKLNRLLEDKIIDYHDSFNLIRSKFIGSGSASVYVANWKNTSTKYAIKRCVDDKEVYLTYLANSHENIIQFRGVTNIEDDEKYSLVLEYAEGGTLGKYLRDFEMGEPIKHPNNILIHKGAIKLADFGRSCQKELECYNTEVWGVLPYVDPKMLEELVEPFPNINQVGQKLPYKPNEKSDIYSLGVLFWELTSRLPPFDGLGDDIIMLKILNGLREKPVPNTNVKYNGLYKECWKQEPDERPHISKVNEVLNIIDSENNNLSTVPYYKEGEESIVHSCQIVLNKLSQKL
ncbi:kinase-like protein [Rhizophagus irregularis]|uniref:Kinase-like protein n=1 Tax=Rhizophagus irregularis TaxID=588596 RepID=A0A2N0RYW5_9GLOM|nr:kinase-like protein [Rhizophagus irregularis]